MGGRRLVCRATILLRPCEIITAVGRYNPSTGRSRDRVDGSEKRGIRRLVVASRSRRRSAPRYFVSRRRVVSAAARSRTSPARAERHTDRRRPLAPFRLPPPLPRAATPLRSVLRSVPRYQHGTRREGRRQGVATNSFGGDRRELRADRLYLFYVILRTAAVISSRRDETGEVERRPAPGAKNDVGALRARAPFAPLGFA